MIEVRLGTAADGQPAQADEPTEPAELREYAGRLARKLPAGTTVLARPGLTGPRLSAFVEGLALGGYRLSYATTPSERRSIILTEVNDTAAFERGVADAAAIGWARDLGNTPAATLTPAAFGAAAIETLAPLGVEVLVRDEDWLAGHDFGGVLAVGGGAKAGPRLIEARWRPRGAGSKHVVLVGKGITFDTGGLNIKPGESMRSMKTDMCGGAAVLAAIRLIAERRIPVRVTALVAAAENSFGGASYRPGDVVRHVGGRTSEITNTDAEGRIVLADALAYAVAQLKPSVLVDVATLTGAMKVALGLRTAGIFATDDRLAAQLCDAGVKSGDLLWRMPLLADYEANLGSSIADADQAPGNPGALTAALFLKHFVGDVPWAHLDIAGPARATKDDGLRTQGPTGFGSTLLATWLESLT